MDARETESLWQPNSICVFSKLVYLPSEFFLIPHCSWLPLISAKHLGKWIHRGTKKGDDWSLDRGMPAKWSPVDVGLNGGLNGDAERSSSWSSLPASQSPKDLAQLHTEHFPARRRVITTFCSTKSSLPPHFSHRFLSSSSPSLFLSGHPLYCLVSFRLPFSCTSQAPQAIHTDWLVFLSCLWLQHLETGACEWYRRMFICWQTIVNKQNYESHVVM